MGSGRRKGAKQVEKFEGVVNHGHLNLVDVFKEVAQNVNQAGYNAHLVHLFKNSLRHLLIVGSQNHLQKLHKPLYKVAGKLARFVNETSNVFHQTLLKELLGTKMQLYLLRPILQVLQQIKSLVNILLSDGFVVFVPVLQARYQMGYDSCNLVGNVFSAENHGLLLLGQQHSLDGLVKVQQENVDGHKYEQFVIVKLLNGQKLTEYLVTLICKYHHDSLV